MLLLTRKKKREESCYEKVLIQQRDVWAYISITSYIYIWRVWDATWDGRRGLSFPTIRLYIHATAVVICCCTEAAALSFCLLPQSLLPSSEYFLQRKRQRGEMAEQKLPWCCCCCHGALKRGWLPCWERHHHMNRIMSFSLNFPLNVLLPMKNSYFPHRHARLFRAYKRWKMSHERVNMTWDMLLPARARHAEEYATELFSAFFSFPSNEIFLCLLSFHFQLLLLPYTYAMSQESWRKGCCQLLSSLWGSHAMPCQEGVYFLIQWFLLSELFLPSHIIWGET